MKLCDTCIYRNNVEQLKPCIIYRDDCEYYEKERGDMTREEELWYLTEQKRANDHCLFDYHYNIALDVAIKALEQEPKTGHWIKVTNGRGGHECDICHEYAPSYQDGDEYLTKYCPNCGCRMVEPQEKRCADCNHYGKLSLDCSRCDDDCSMFEPQESEKV